MILVPGSLFNTGRPLDTERVIEIEDYIMLFVQIMSLQTATLANILVVLYCPVGKQKCIQLECQGLRLKEIVALFVLRTIP